MRPYGPRKFGEWWDERTPQDDSIAKARARKEWIREADAELKHTTSESHDIRAQLMDDYEEYEWIEYLERNRLVLVDCGDAYQVVPEEDYDQALQNSLDESVEPSR